MDKDYTKLEKNEIREVLSAYTGIKDNDLSFAVLGIARIIKAQLAAKDKIIDECEKALKRSGYRSCACGLESAQLLDRIAQMKEGK